MGLVPDFNEGDINRAFDGWKLSIEDKIFEVLKYAGEGFVDAARHLRTYNDITGNLRSSIGFVIAYNGHIKMEDITGDAEGTQAARETVAEVLKKNDNGFVLIGVAGMMYAGYVESQGYDVITANAIEAQNIMEKLINQLFK